MKSIHQVMKIINFRVKGLRGDYQNSDQNSALNPCKHCNLVLWMLVQWTSKLCPFHIISKIFFEYRCTLIFFVFVGPPDAKRCEHSKRAWLGFRAGNYLDLHFDEPVVPARMSIWVTDTYGSRDVIRNVKLHFEGRFIPLLPTQWHL